MTSDLNAEDVKNKLFHSLKSRGVLDSLKSQLRKQLIRELQDTTGLPVLHSTVKASSTEKESDGIPLFQRAANSIVAEYLKRCNFEYTLSTFLPESGTTLEKRFSCKDVLHLLNIDPRSKLYLNLERSLSSTTDSKGFLWHFLMEVAALQSRMKCDVNIQTEDTLPTQISVSLEDKLSSVEKEYREKQKLVQLDKNQGLEERLIAMQKKYEVEKKNELEEEVKKFRATELSRLRMDARQKYEAKIKAIRHEYDEEFNIKNHALRALEKEMLERVERLQEVHQSEAYAERQKFLEEMRSFKEREADFKNRTLMQERSQKLEEDRLMNEVEKLKFREDAMKEKENILAQRFNTEVENFKSDYERQHSARNQELMRRESRVEAERSKLDGKREEFLKCQEELATFKEKCFQLQSSVEASNLLSEDLKRRKQDLEQKLAEMKDYHALKEKEIILTKDIEHLTQRLTETNLHCKAQEKRHHKLVKDLTETTGKPSEEVVILRQELKIAKERYNEKEKASYEERKTLEIQLESQIQRANHFRKIFEEQVSTQRFLETEIENLKMMQEQTERLLSMELRHQNANNSNVSSSTRRNLTVQKTASRRKTRQDVSLRRHEISTRVPTQRLEAEESSTMDESSLASIIEDKKSFEKFERESAALDASYRDFQSRMTVPPRYSVASIPSSLTFRRLASYHSVHSPPLPSGTNVGIGGFNLAAQDSKDEFRPLKQVYDEADVPDHVRQYASAERQNSEKSAPRNEYSVHENNIPYKQSSGQSDSDVESGRLNEDESVALSMNDLNPVHLPPGNIHNKGTIRVLKDTSTTGLSQRNEEIEINNEHPNLGVPKDTALFRWNQPEKTSKNMKLEGKISSSRLVNESDEIFEAQNISPALVDSTDASLDQTENRMTESGVNSRNVGNCQQGVSGRHAELSVSEPSNSRTGLNASDVNQYSKERTLDGTDVRKEENGLTEADEGRRSKRSSTSSDKSLSHGSLHDNSHTYGKLPCSAVRQRDNSGSTREQIDVGTLNMDKRRHSTELDMAEIEERRRRDTEHFQEGANDYDLEDASSTKSSRSVGGASEGISGGNSLRSSHDGETVEENNENNDQDLPIDPVMLKYMEMIKQRRETENKTIEEKSVNISSKVDSHDFSDQESCVSIGKNEDVSMGKLSDDDFNWE